MKEYLIAIFVGLISSFCYDFLKNIISKIKSPENTPKNQKEINTSALKFQFCYCMIIGILMLSFTDVSTIYNIESFIILLSLPCFCFFSSFNAFFHAIKIIENIQQKPKNKYKQNHKKI